MCSPAYYRHTMKIAFYGVEGIVERVSAHSTRDHFHPFASRMLPYIIVRCRLCIVDRSSSITFYQVKLRFSHGSKYFSAARFCYLYGNMSNATGAPMYPYLLVLLHISVVYKPFPGSDEDQRYSSRLVKG